MSLKSLTMKSSCCSLLVPLLATSAAAAVTTLSAAESIRPNILLMTADDMSYNSLGCMGNTLPSITPNLDRLAREGIMFEHCYNATPMCGPSRNALYTGMYPQCNGYMGHGIQPPTWWRRAGNQRPKASIISRLYDNGYYTGLVGKHGTAACKFSMHAEGDFRQTGMGRDPKRYYAYVKKFFDNAKASGKPFFLAANAHDPHDCWAGHPAETKGWIDAGMRHLPYKTYANGKPYPEPMRTYQAKDCIPPLCYPNDIRFKEDLKHYYASVNRMDQVLGTVLKALEESGMADNTVVIFISDHGLSWCMSKWTLYPTATRTPLIVKYPGKIKGGQRNRDRIISTVDIAPTIAKLCGVQPLEGINGQSFDQLLVNPRAPWGRQVAFSCFNFMNNEPPVDSKIPEYSPDLSRHFEDYRPSRSLSNQKYTYIWNAWSDGKSVMPPAMLGDDIRFLKKYAGKDEVKGYPDYAKRVDFLLHHVPEEFYDLEKDPGCLDNLAGQPQYAETIRSYRGQLLKVLEETKDQELPNYRKFLKKN